MLYHAIISSPKPAGNTGNTLESLMDSIGFRSTVSALNFQSWIDQVWLPCPNLSYGKGLGHSGAVPDDDWMDWMGEIFGSLNRCGHFGYRTAHFGSVFTWFNTCCRMSNIKSLLLHKNLLAKWQDVECAASPGNLEWLTLYGNPITSQPEYQAGRVSCLGLSVVQKPLANELILLVCMSYARISL